MRPAWSYATTPDWYTGNFPAGRPLRQLPRQLAECSEGRSFGHTRLADALQRKLARTPVRRADMPWASTPGKSPTGQASPAFWGQAPRQRRPRRRSQADHDQLQHLPRQRRHQQRQQRQRAVQRLPSAGGQPGVLRPSPTSRSMWTAASRWHSRRLPFTARRS